MRIQNKIDIKKFIKMCADTTKPFLEMWFCYPYHSSVSYTVVFDLLSGI